MSASTSMKTQKQRENALRRMTKAIPDAIREQWGLHDYTEELKAREPRLFSSMVGPAADRFFRLQKIVTVNPHPPAANKPAEAPRVEHAAYHEAPTPIVGSPDDPMARAWAEMQARIDKDCKAITGRPRPMTLHKGQLEICTEYQRDRVTLSRIESIAITPNLNAFGHLIVAHRDGKYWIVDGQHRWMAACKRNDMDLLPCLVHDSPSVADEARLYCLINLRRTVVSAIDRYRALLTAEDQVAVEVATCLEALDIRIAAHANGPRQLSCIGKVYAMAQRDSRQCELVLSVTQELSTTLPISNDLVDALAYIDLHAIDGLMNALLLVRLKKLGIHKVLDVIAKAKAARAGQPAGLMIIGEVNRGLPQGKRIRLRNVLEEENDDD